MLRIVFFIFISLLLSACTPPVGTPGDMLRVKSQFAFYNLNAQYQRAVNDAKTISPLYLRDDLIIIDNKFLDKRLVTTKIQNKEMVLVATFLKKDYLPYWMIRDPFKLDFDSFVTIPGEWEDKAEDFLKLDDAALHDRIIKKVGMHYLSENSHFVVFYADAEAMIRPAYNPDISSKMTYLGYSESATLNFKHWLDKKISDAYDKAPYFPFTRLGYTYDWGSKNPRKDGLTEFVVPKGTLIKVKNILSYQDFIKYYVRLPTYRKMNEPHLKYEKTPFH